MKLLVIFGTAHSLQMGSVGKTGLADYLLKQEIERVCVDYKISLIAEEMNEEWLKRRGISRTIGQIVADQYRLDHAFCDPTSETRSQLGIRDTQVVQLDAFIGKWEEKKRASELKRSWDLREEYILSCIKNSGQDRILLICGANHVQGFADKSGAMDLSAEVAHGDWEPNTYENHPCQ